MLDFNSTKIINGVYYLSENNTDIFDEDIYLQVRKQEGRLYTDSILKRLPLINKDHPLFEEWCVRKRSANKIAKYISNKKYNNLLEIGCGNGWLCNYISERCGCFAIGIDLNKFELEQAARVFGKSEKVKFIYGNIYENIFPPALFEIIIFAASIQYFKNLNLIITSVLPLLKPKGEIHIIDTYFYDKAEIENAKNRSDNYYKNLGFPLMSKNYYHHSWDELSYLEYDEINFSNNNFIKVLKKLKISSNAKFPWIIFRSK